jgi:hypothetical protein
MTKDEPKLTPGPWFNYNGIVKRVPMIAYTNQVYNADGSMVAACMSIRNYEADANLISASPDMYENEAKNLCILEIMLDIYKELLRLFKEDIDVKNALLYLPEGEVLEEIVAELGKRVECTKNILVRARGETEQC